MPTTDYYAMAGVQFVHVDDLEKEAQTPEPAFAAKRKKLENELKKLKEKVSSAFFESRRPATGAVCFG